jgi:hypothetical protein
LPPADEGTTFRSRFWSKSLQKLMKRWWKIPPGKAMSVKASGWLNMGITAFTAGWSGTARSSAVVPRYEMP